MLTIGRRWLAIAALCATAAGCTSWALKSWPPYAEASQAGQGALLLKMNSKTKMGGFWINSVLLMWPDKEEVGPHKWSSSQHFRIDTRPQDGTRVLADDLILIPFRPGSYSRLIVRFFFVGQEIHYVDIDMAKPLSFTVTPGKVTVIGRLDLDVALEVTGFTSKGTEFKSESKVRLDDSPAAKAALVREALARPETDSLQWRAPLEAAQRDLAAKR